jgi:hypothetical protein
MGYEEDPRAFDHVSDCHEEPKVEGPVPEVYYHIQGVNGFDTRSLKVALEWCTPGRGVTMYIRGNPWKMITRHESGALSTTQF